MSTDDMPGPRLGLERITILLKALGNPHLRVPIVHVAGTNGKGSICAYLDSIFRKAGLRTGRFNSPHLVEPSDSILLNGYPCSPALFRAASHRVEAVGMEASPFEQLTATAFSLFAETEPKLDVAVVEVGMGGATDATNVCPSPLATVLGPVDLDHQALLGDTVEEIARVKCGIFKASSPAVISAQAHSVVSDIADEVARQVGASLTRAEEGLWQDDGSLRIPELDIVARPSLAGRYQAVNASVAAMTAHVLRKRNVFEISDQQIVNGLETTEWPGRLSHVRLPGIGDVLVDGAHNPASAAHLREHIASLRRAEQTTLIIALSAPRDPVSILKPLLKGLDGARVVATGFSLPVQGMPWVRPVEIDDIVQAACGLGVQATEAADLQSALSKAEGRIIVCGSLYLVADLYRLQSASSQRAATSA